jgi:hypothetical protein
LKQLIPTPCNTNTVKCTNMFLDLTEILKVCPETKNIFNLQKYFFHFLTEQCS